MTDGQEEIDEQAEARKRAFLTNFTVVVDGGKEKQIGLNAPAIHKQLAWRTDNWPRRVDTALFVENGSCEPLWLTTPADLFAWLQSVFGNGDANAVLWVDRGTGFVTQTQIHAYLCQKAKAYKSVESSPHCPPLKGHYYMHPTISTEGISGKLDELLRFFSPATPEDGLLLAAWALTLCWGGPYGQRPAFLFTAEDDDPEMGRGVGKTTAVRMFSKLVGGTFDLRPSDKWEDTIRRLLSNTDCSTQRVILIDNVKVHRFSWADVEALITAEYVNGRKMYVGDGRRPNTFIVAITLNGASLSKDLAQRSIIIKLKRPFYSGNWEGDVAAFIDAYRWEIIGDILAMLQRPLRKLGAYSRWGIWEREIIGRLPNPEVLQQLIQARREAVDDDQEESQLVRDAIRSALQDLGYGDPDNAGVRFRAAMMAQIVSQALNDKLSTTAAGTKLKAMGGAIPELKRSKYCGRMVWIWRGCNHSGDTEELIERMFGVQR